MLWVSPGASAQAPGAGPVLIVTYVEAPPAKRAALAAYLQAYAGQIENGPGKTRVTVLREFGRPNRMGDHRTMAGIVLSLLSPSLKWR
jgi:hypothetical protein